MQYVTQSAVPAGIWGLLLLFVSLRIYGRIPRPIRLGGDLLIRHMPLFFLPAFISLIGYRALLQEQGMSLFLALMASTLLALGVAALLMQFLLSKGSPKSKRDD